MKPVDGVQKAAEDLAMALSQQQRTQALGIRGIRGGTMANGSPVIYVVTTFTPEVLRSQLPAEYGSFPVVIQGSHKTAEAADRLGRSLLESPSSGVAVVLPLPPEVGELFVLPGCEPMTDLHVTLMFLGKVNDYTAKQIADMLLVVEHLAQETPAISGKVSGVGRFNTESPDGDAIYLSIDAPTLGDVRAKLVRRFEDAGFHPSTLRGFTAHCTLAYVPAKIAPPMEHFACADVLFPRIALWAGAQRTDYSLSGALESKLHQQARALREYVFGASWMGGGHSYPGPEPGKLFSLGVLYPGPPERVDDEELPEPKKSGHDREQNRWRERNRSAKATKKP